MGLKCDGARPVTSTFSSRRDRRRPFAGLVKAEPLSLRLPGNGGRPPDAHPHANLLTHSPLFPRLHQTSETRGSSGSHQPRPEKVKKSRGGRFTRGGSKHRDAKADPKRSREDTLRHHHFSKGELLVSSIFSALLDANRTKSAYSGRPPPPKARKAILEDWKNGTLGEKMTSFERIGYTP